MEAGIAGAVELEVRVRNGRELEFVSVCDQLPPVGFMGVEKRLESFDGSLSSHCNCPYGFVALEQQGLMMMMMMMMCAECGEREAHSRTLCMKCYASARRSGTLNDYPTQAYLDDPESHVRWAFGNDPLLIADVAIEYGFRLVKNG